MQKLKESFYRGSTGFIRSCRVTLFSFKYNTKEYKVIIKLKSKKHGVKDVFIDDEDHIAIGNNRLYISKPNDNYFRVSIYVNGRQIILSRYLISPDKDEIVDHINRNPLDNRRSNLRICSHSENMCNRASSRNSTSKYLGVYWDKDRCKYKSQMTKNRKTIALGRFDNEIDAAKAYDKKALELHGDYANLNFKIRESN